MMQLTEISGLARYVNEDWQSPVADAVAARWGIAPGVARWWRSSASHVFVVPGTPEPDTARYLRFVPERYAAYGRFGAIAELMDRLHDSGLALAPPVRSAGGRLVETVETPIGTVRAMCLTEAPGEETEVEELTLAQARAWGALLADTHRHAAALGPGVTGALPRPLDTIAGAARLYADDTELAAAVTKLAARLAGLARDPEVYGVVHGDFELDNLAWESGTATAFDFDEAAHSWYAADIAHAVRDLTDGGRPDPARAGLLDSFLAGYREVRPLPGAGPDELLLFAGANAARSLVELHPVFATLDEGRPDDLDGLRADLAGHRDEQRRIVIAAAGRPPAAADARRPHPPWGDGRRPGGFSR
ncbi:phosphotransferase enzyme family protein [Streptomyces tsukubensis]|uniref:phosphotransferase enzyme family protein n=1 Tax=Streptomyces tsukubensis TaxID=83656 RepID=UPI0036B1EEC3